MSKITKVPYLEFYELVADIEDTFTINERIEECHGEHIFEDTTLISQKMLTLKIVIGNEEINILNRLTQKEINLLLSK